MQTQQYAGERVNPTPSSKDAISDINTRIDQLTASLRILTTALNSHVNSIVGMDPPQDKPGDGQVEPVATNTRDYLIRLESQRDELMHVVSRLGLSL